MGKTKPSEICKTVNIYHEIPGRYGKSGTDGLIGATGPGASGMGPVGQSGSVGQSILSNPEIGLNGFVGTFSAPIFLNQTNPLTPSLFSINSIVPTTYSYEHNLTRLAYSFSGFSGGTYKLEALLCLNIPYTGTSFTNLVDSYNMIFSIRKNFFSAPPGVVVTSGIIELLPSALTENVLISALTSTIPILSTDNLALCLEYVSSTGTDLVGTQIIIQNCYFYVELIKP